MADSNKRTCPVCTKQYCTVSLLPKGLPCGHTFCEPCLIGIQQRSFNQMMSCPECNVEHFGDPKNLGTIYALLGDVKAESPAKPSRFSLPFLNKKGKLTIRTPKEREKFTVEIHFSEPVLKLKALIYQRTGVQPASQVLSFNGKQLDDDNQKLSFYNLRNGSEIAQSVKTIGGR